MITRQTAGVSVGNGPRMAASVDSEACDVLLRHGGLATIDEMDNGGSTALMYAVMAFSSGPLRPKPGSRSAILETLLASNASMSVKNDKGWTALGLAEDLGLDDIVTVLKQEEARRRGEL